MSLKLFYYHYQILKVGKISKTAYVALLYPDTFSFHWIGQIYPFILACLCLARAFSIGYMIRVQNDISIYMFTGLTRDTELTVRM